MIEKTCSTCKTNFIESNIYDMRKHFSTHKSTRDKLETRCKECKREQAKKYTNKNREAMQEKYKTTYERRKKEGLYISNNVEHMTTENIDAAIEILQNRLKELKKEQKKRLKVK